MLRTALVTQLPAPISADEPRLACGHLQTSWSQGLGKSTLVVLGSDDMPSMEGTGKCRSLSCGVSASTSSNTGSSSLRAAASEAHASGAAAFNAANSDTPTHMATTTAWTHCDADLWAQDHTSADSAEAMLLQDVWSPTVDEARGSASSSAT